MLGGHKQARLRRAAQLLVAGAALSALARLLSTFGYLFDPLGLLQVGIAPLGSLAVWIGLALAVWQGIRWSRAAATVAVAVPLVQASTLVVNPSSIAGFLVGGPAALVAVPLILASGGLSVAALVLIWLPAPSDLSGVSPTGGGPPPSVLP